MACPVDFTVLINDDLAIYLNMNARCQGTFLLKGCEAVINHKEVLGTKPQQAE